MTDFPTEPENEEQRVAYEELRRHPVEITWERVRGGIWVARLIKEPPAAPIKHKRPPCDCAIQSSRARRPGPHHDEDCARRQPW